ncbi:YlaI family protein [Virgibacillus alimentarius]|uniref:Uncharacterized protein YlaI n=1 Tax=Virgibacillus alimentarius TaxID=698769 RepID=A0ABS4S6P7_9BACI|nr:MULTISPECIES: YlaI family protein [Virgibacillus]MBP2256072.1 uncharacterized protein YlaI [Virgibacillus alimentarius]HLR66019.1 YlaI family protein [Virgibacillus sp.]
MKVKCVLCDTIEELENSSLHAKRLRNSKLRMYLCNSCYERIAQRTKERHETGNFHLYKENKQDDDII